MKKGANALKVGSVFQYRAWKLRQFEATAARESRLIQALLAAVPLEINSLLVEKCNIVNHILHEGTVTCAYRDADGGALGYHDLDELRKWFRLLRKAWKGVVSISIRTKPGHLAVTYKAVEAKDKKP